MIQMRPGYSENLTFEKFGGTEDSRTNRQTGKRGHLENSGAPVNFRKTTLPKKNWTFENFGRIFVDIYATFVIIHATFVVI